MEVDKQLKFKSHKRMQEEFILNNIDVMTHDCLSSVALVLDSVNHQGILFKLCSVGIGSYVLSILTWLCSNRPEYVILNGFRSRLVNVVSGVPQSSNVGPMLFLQYLMLFLLFLPMVSLITVVVWLLRWLRDHSTAWLLRCSLHFIG